MTPLEYFNNEVLYTVEIEMKFGGRYWSDGLHTDEVDAYIKRHTERGDYLSDIDFICEEHQPNSFVRRVMKLADLNFFKNEEFRKKNEITSIDEMIKFICENDLWRVSE